MKELSLVPPGASPLLDADNRFGPAPYPETDDQDESLYAAYTNVLLEERRRGMEQLFLTWTQNLLFLAGYQWWKFDIQTGAFAPTKAPKWKEQPVYNILLPFFTHRMGKLTKNRPRLTAVAASTDPDDVESAKLGDDVLRGKWQQLSMTRVSRRWLAWLFTTGQGYVAPYWNTDSGILEPLTQLVQAEKVDPVTGAPIGIEMVECPCDEAGEPVLDENGNYDMEAAPAYVDIGEIGYKVYSPFQVFPDLDAQDDDEVRQVVITEVLTVREVTRRWPHLAGMVSADDTTDLDRYDQLITAALAGPDTHLTGGGITREVDVPKAIVKHYFKRPDEEHPFGRNWVSVNNRLCESPGPLPDGVWPPYVRIRDIEVPGRYHADCAMTAGVGLQREYNEVNAQIKEHHNLMLRGKWLVPLGSNIRRGQITAEPGEVIQHTPGLPPTMAELRPLPQKIYDERERILGDFEYITGTHRISMGSPPPGITSGRAFLVLQEADDSDIGPLTEMYEEGMAELGWLSLQIIQRFYEEERLVRVAGDNHSFRVRAFKGADLSSIVDVVAQVGSAFPWSKTAMQSMMIEMASTVPATFMDPDTGQFDLERFRRALPVGGEDSVGLESDLDVAEAMREHEAFEMWEGEVDPTGAPDLPTPQPWQNHRIHLRSHGRVLKSAAFRKWNPLARMLFVEHYQQTLLNLAVQPIPPTTDGAPVLNPMPGAAPGGGGGGPEMGGAVQPGPAPDQNPTALSAAEQDPTTG